MGRGFPQAKCAAEGKFLQQPCDLKLADFFLTELPHVLAAANEIAVSSHDNRNHVSANVAFVHLSLFSHEPPPFY
jgi:hypothetical protein